MAARIPKTPNFEVEVTQRGSITIPPEIRDQLGFNKSQQPFRFIIEQREGGLFLRPAVTIPVRDFSVSEMQDWIDEDVRAVKDKRRK